MGQGNRGASIQRGIAEQSRHCLASGENQRQNPAVKKAMEGIHMTNGGRPFLSILDTMLGDRGRDTIYPCIRDLVEHGLDLARFSAGEITPQRQDITQYLAAW